MAISDFIKEAGWHNAVTYKKHPHEWIRDIDYTGEDLGMFRQVMGYIDKYGQIEYFFKKPYKYFYDKRYKYWYIDDGEPPIIINRVRVTAFSMHAIFDLHYTRLPYLPQFLQTLVEINKMKPLMKPLVLDVEPTDKGDEGGHSGVIIIQESHITFHTFEASKYMQLDINTCHRQGLFMFDTVEFIEQVLRPDKVTLQVIRRDK